MGATVQLRIVERVSSSNNVVISKSLQPAGLTYTTRPRREATCVIVVAFGPDVRLSERLATIALHAREIVVIDNGSGPDFSAILENARSSAEVTLISNSENRGVAAALNQGVEFALSRGFEWALLLDQDSRVLPALLDGAQKAYDEFPDPNKIAVIGADHDNPFHYKKRKRYPTAGAYREMRTVITSGSFISLPVFKQIGAFREELFIDSVDDDYCMRARRLGFAVIEATAFGISHKIGAPKIVRFLGKSRSTSNHAPMRRYYMARNRLVLAATYLVRDPAWAFLLAKSLLREMLFVAIFEEQKREKLRATWLGIYDAVIGRMGKLNERRLSHTRNE
jgi:rhamnosyltransferase